MNQLPHKLLGTSSMSEREKNGSRVRMAEQHRRRPSG